MFALGHLGIGRRLAARRYAGMSRRDRWLFMLGTVLPDLIDKPLYYIPSWITGREGAALGIVAGTHSFGHTGLFLVTLLAAWRWLQKRHAGPAAGVGALAIGVATHLFLDTLGLTMDARTAVWPLLGWQFTPFRHHGLGQHLRTVFRPVTLAGELIGGAVLLWDTWRNRPSRVAK
jgi:hypothetical protein